MVELDTQVLVAGLEGVSSFMEMLAASQARSLPMVAQVASMAAPGRFA